MPMSSMRICSPSSKASFNKKRGRTMILRGPSRLKRQARFGGKRSSELDRNAAPEVTTNRVEVARVGIRIEYVVGVKERRLLVEQVVDAELDARIQRFDVVAQRHVAIGGRTVLVLCPMNRAVAAVEACAIREHIL